ncbi:MAG TPA: D-ribose pyranase [Burkholderiaceae bacterium]|nr:D-ribose pyranase [Burkholderiaceae bacterium]
MKKTPLLHSALSHAIARLGHGDMLVIADAGLPVPEGTPCIDLAVTRGVPAFMQVLAAVLSEMQVERFIVARELRARSPTMRDQIDAAFATLTAQEISHEDLKSLTRQARAVVRTGEFTPYANVVLVAGVVF